MWTANLTDCAGGVRVELERDSAPARYVDVINAWCEDPQFCSWFSSLLAESSFAALRWETPAVDASTATERFEFVLLDAPGLAPSPDPGAFADAFRRQPDAEVVEFANLGGDAILIVPRPIAPPAAYGHLAAFVRNGPESQRQALWRAVGDAMRRRVGSKPVWLSTAGAGVSWLHVRLDDRPKYYHWREFTLRRSSSR